MPTSIGAYATLAAVKARLSGTFGSSDDAVLQTLCDQVNQDIESTTGRILAPIPAFTTTLAAGVLAGATSVSLTSATGLARGDALMFGPVSGTHEHGIVAAISGTTITLQAALANAYSSGAAVERVQLFDGFSAQEGGRLMPISNGIVAATSVEVALYTGGPFSLIPGTDWYIRPTPLEREPGWPGTELWMTNIPSGGNTTPYFPPGFANVRVAGSFGWPAILDDVTDIALTAAIRAWNARQGGQADIIGSDEFGKPIVSKILSARDRERLRRYTDKTVAVL